MAEGKRYFWFKLYDDFFTSKRIKKLRKLAGGDTYTIIYLKLQLIAMKNNGIIEWSGLEDDFAEEIALDIDESPDDIKVTLTYLLSCGLAETSDNISFFFPYAVANVGSEGSSAKRVREHRKNQKVLHCNADVTQVKRICNGEKEIDKELDTDKEKDILFPKQTKHKYGEYKNVLLTDTEYGKLKERFPDVDARIKKLDEGIELKGYKYKSHYLAIIKWAEKDKPSPIPEEKDGIEALLGV